MTDIRCPQLTATIAGRWLRFYIGITFRPKRLRHHRFDGHRLWAIRLWPIRHLDYKHNWRIAGFQTRAAVPTDKRLRIWT